MITPLLSANLDLGKWSLGEFKKSSRGQSFANIFCGSGQSCFKLSDKPLYSKFGLGAFDPNATRMNLELTLDDETYSKPKGDRRMVSKVAQRCCGIQTLGANKRTWDKN